MKSGSLPFQFDLSELFGRLRRATSGRLGDVTLTLPFVSIAVHPKDLERRVAREIVIRLKDRRVLSAWECCDDCIDQALASLQEIRRILVDKEVELADAQDGSLYLLAEVMVSGIRQFLTFEQRLNRKLPPGHGPSGSGHHRPPETRQAYFDGLEMLRGHLSRCLGQVAAIAGMDAPTDGLIPHYSGEWEIDAYLPPPTPL